MCKTKYCRKPAKRAGLCYSCEKKQTIAANPYRYAYQTLKDNATRRGKRFTLTLEYWIKWCDETGYLAMKGRGADDATVDCIENELGYADGNIRPLTRSDNSSKGVKKVAYNHITGEFDIITQSPVQQEQDLPF